jgi:hypothetical protein
VAGDTALISSLRDDDLGPNSGSLYVYELQSGTWTLADKVLPEEGTAGETGKLTAEGAGPGDKFACSVALSRDTALVGALEGDGAVADTGTAYVFSIGTLCGVALPYGCGINPPGSLTVSAAPALGTFITLGVDDPSGMQPPGASAFLAVATTPDAGFPCGALLPGGAGGAGDGELLLGLSPAPFLVLSGGAWSGAGAAVPFALPVPADTTLLGVSVFVQGLLVAAAVGTPGASTLTGAVELRLGF